MNIFVGGSSNSNINREYLRENKKILSFILDDNDLVYEPSNTGIMRLAHNEAVRKGRHITGVCLNSEKDKFDIAKCNKQVTATSVYEKVKILAEESDLLLFLPGGETTYFELFSALEAKRCNEFDKPIIIFNFNGFFDNIKDTIEQKYIEYFKNSDNLYGCVIVDSSFEVIVNYMKCKMAQDSSNQKYQYIYGLLLLKDTLKEFDIYPYRKIQPYFTYPLSLIENNVENAVKMKTDTNEFYKEQCDELWKLYQRFLTTILVCQNEVGNRRERKNARRVLGHIINNQY